MNKKSILAISLLAALAVTGCGKKNSSSGIEDAKTYTFREFLTTCPSNWNELTYQDSNDTEIMDFISGAFFRFNYKFGADGKPLDGEFVVDYDGATALEDISDVYAGNDTYAVPADAEKGDGYAYKITLREDLKWDDGTPIKAKDFVYTMKQQEDPLFQNYRADSFYNGDTIIHNAQEYLKQGQSNVFASRSVFGGVYDESIDDQLIFDGYLGDEPEGGECSYIINWFRGRNGTGYDDYFKKDSDTPIGVFVIPYLYEGISSSLAECVAMSAALDGKTFAEIKADATLKSYWDLIIGWWQTDPGEELDFFVTNYTYPAVDFNDVGIKVGEKENELIIILDKSLPLLKDDGSLSYLAAYNMSSLPLVKESLYEANKIAPTEEGGLWKSRYNSSLETSASWGPYKLTSFEAGKQFVLERNTNWYGYNMEKYTTGPKQYQTDKIICDIIPEYKTALLEFKNGNIQSIGIDVSVAQDYKNSERAVFTASDFVGSLQLQSNAEKLAERSDSEHNKLLLKYVDFRKAISLCIDRADYCNECTTASLAGFGLFNSMHYYDVENGGVYRNTDEAKRVICEVYGVNVADYNSLDEAYAAVTGYNLNLAKELLTSAYNAALAAGDITETDIVVLTVGDSEDTEAGRRIFNYLKNSVEELAKGTPLEGRLTLDYDPSHGSKWANDFRDGLYDICTGGWTGAAWNPGYFLLAYLSPDYMYSKAWDTSAYMLTFNPYGDGQEEHNYTMSLIEWYDCLNGNSGCKQNWGKGQVDEDFRLGIIAALEKEILVNYYTVPLQYRFSAGLLSYKVEYISRNYNTFMGYGGIRYMTYNYDDAAWEQVKGTFDYTK